MQKLKRVVIKEELVALTGKVNHAVVLNQMIYWSERVKDSDRFIKEEMDRQRRFMDGSQESEEDVKDYLKNGWIYKTADEMVEECMNITSRQTMSRIFNDLVKNGWLDKRKNPKYKWDKTWQYRVNLTKIQMDLQKLGYSLEGYSLLSNQGEEEEAENEQSSSQNEQSGSQIETSSSQNEQSSAHSEQAIPKITTDITSDTTSEILSIKEGENNDIRKSIEKEGKKDRLNELQKIITKKDLPIPVTKPMMMYTERLLEDNVSIEDIENVYYANKDYINEYQFGNILSNVLYETKGKIRNIRALLQTAIKNYFQDMNEVESRKELLSTEIVPDWFKNGEHRKRADRTEEQNNIPYNLEGARQRFGDIFDF